MLSGVGISIHVSRAFTVPTRRLECRKCLKHFLIPGMAGTEGHGGQEALLTTLTSLAHRAVAALGLSTGLTAETPHGKVHIDPDAGYRALCHVGIQLHFQHGQGSGYQEPAPAKPSKPDRGDRDLTGNGREKTCSSVADQLTVPVALRPDVAEIASTSRQAAFSVGFLFVGARN